MPMAFIFIFMFMWEFFTGQSCIKEALVQRQYVNIVCYEEKCKFVSFVIACNNVDRIVHRFFWVRNCISSVQNL